MKREVSEKIQEIRSYTRESQYMDELGDIPEDYEKHLIRGELLVGGLVNSAQGILKLGLASVIIIGAEFFSSASISIFTCLVFLMVASRGYAPVSEVFNNLTARFWDADKGKILLGGQDVSGIDPETLLQSCSVVFQDVVLFNTSVMNKTG